MAEGKKELVLVNNEFAWVKDLSGGMIYVYLGPHKEPLSVDSVIVIQNSNREFIPIGGDLLKGQTFTQALENQYVILHNPEILGTRPMTRGKNEAVQLQTGKSVVKRGPCEFPLWPGQQTEVVDGHRMTSNQFLRIRVEGEIAAADIKPLQDLIMEDWLRPKPVQPEVKGSSTEVDAVYRIPRTSEEPETIEVKPPELTIGSEWIVRGSRTKFFIPPTGVTVLPATDHVTRSNDPYVMNGVQLEADEFVTLKNRSGRISYVLGPTTVIPCEDQVFSTDTRGNPKYKATSIDEKSGVLLRTLVAMTQSEIQRRMGSDVRVQFTPIAGSHEDRDESEDEDRSRDEKSLPPGTQLVVWRTKRLVFPADGIEITKKFEAIHILAGTARYVKNFLTGRTRIVQGECLYLADPRCEEFVTRDIPEDTLALWFPGSTIDNYDSDLVPCITIPQGTAAMILKRGANAEVRRTIVGYATYFLEWNETLCVMKLSASRGGEAKSYKNAIRVCYLWMQGNRINDVLTDGRTREDCQFEVQYTLSVDFDPDHKDSWFNVDDYVFLVCEEVRSRLRGGLLATSINDLSTNYVEIIRDIILGAKPVEPTKDSGNDLLIVGSKIAPHRPGIQFPRFGATLVDININGFQILDPRLQDQLRRLQMSGIEESVKTRQAQTALEGQQRRSEIEREQAILQRDSTKFSQTIELETTTSIEDTKRKKLEEEKQTKLAEVASQKESALAELDSSRETSEIADGISAARKKAQATIATIDAQVAELHKSSALLGLMVTDKQKEIDRIDAVDRMKAQAEAAATINESILPTISAHLEAIKDSIVGEKLVTAFGSVAHFRGMDVVELASQALSSLPSIGKVLGSMRRNIPADNPPPNERRPSR
jgi:hypothetical protein